MNEPDAYANKIGRDDLGSAIENHFYNWYFPYFFRNKIEPES